MRRRLLRLRDSLSTVAAEPSAEAAASVVLASKMLRRLNAWSSKPDLSALGRSDIVAPGSDDTSKSDVTGGRVDRLRMACSRAITAAVIRRAQVRAAFEHFAWNFDVG